MLWFLITILSYFFFAFVAIVDKYILKVFIPHPKIYAFYFGAFGIFALFLTPLGFSVPEIQKILLALFSGAIAVPAVLSLYTALRNYEASRVIPASGSLTALFLFVFSFILSGREFLGAGEISAFGFLLFGGILFIPFPGKGLIAGKFLQLVIISAFLFSLSLAAAKFVYLGQPFWSGLIWIKIGGVLAAIPLLFSKEVGEELFKKRATFKLKLAKLYLFNQVLATVGGLLQSYALALVPLTLLAFVSALQSTQYVFLLLLAIFLSLRFPRILKEDVSRKVIFRKIVAIFFIGAGLILLSFLG